MIDKRIEVINEGRRAQIVLDNFAPYMEKQIVEVLSQMKQAFRRGEIDAKVYLAGISTLCALEDIENNLKSSINKSRKEAL